MLYRYVFAKHADPIRRMYCRTTQSGTKYCANKFLKSGSFIADNHWASKVAEAVLTDGASNKCGVVFEANPGNGPLTQLILSNRTHHVIAWEARSSFWEHLEWLKVHYPGNFEYRKKRFVKELSFTLPTGLAENVNNSDYRFTVIGSFGNMQEFMIQLVFQLAQNLGPWHLGHIEFYLIVTGLEYRLITEAIYFWKQKYYLRLALYELFFDCSLVLTIPVTAFNNCQFIREHSSNVEFDHDNMYLMKLTKRKNSSMSDPKCCSKNNVSLVYFLRWVNGHRRHRVISTLENWCPEVGLQLIDVGITMMDCFVDLPIHNLPDVCNILISHKNYAYSPIKNLLEGTDKLQVSKSCHD